MYYGLRWAGIYRRPRIFAANLEEPIAPTPDSGF